MILRTLYTASKKDRYFLLSYVLFSFAIGVFISTYDVWVHVSFFSKFGYKYFASSYFLSGLLGVGIAFLFSTTFQKYNSRQLTYLTLGMVTLFVFGMLSIYVFVDQNMGTYLGMVFFFPVNMILALSMWRYARILVTSLASRKVFPTIKVSNFVGLAFGGIGMTITVFYVPFASLNYVSLCALILLWPLLIILANSLKTYPGKREETLKFVPVKNKTVLFYSSNLTTYLLLFSILSAVVGFSIHFMFINVAWAGFFTIIGMAKFYGLYIFLAMVLVYGIDKYIIKRILYSYDSPFAILVIPALVFVILAIAVSGYFLLGSFRPHEHFTMFFLLLSMVYVSYTISLITIQKQALRTLFHALDVRFRQYVYSRIEGVAPMFGLAISGSVILSLSFLKFYSLAIVLVFCIITTILWGWVAVKLIMSYRKAQDLTLSRMRSRDIGNTSMLGFIERNRAIMNSDNASKIIAALELAKLHQPSEYEVDLRGLLKHPSDVVKVHALNCIRDNNVESAYSELEDQVKMYKGEIQALAKKVIESFDGNAKLTDNVTEIRNKVYNGSVKERMQLPTLIAKTDLPEADGLLTTLSKDHEIEVRHAAVKAMSRRGNKKFSYSLIDFLYPEYFDPYAIDAIASSGDISLEYLEREADLPAVDDLVLARIMRLYGKIGTERSINTLLSKIGSLNDYTMLQGIQALQEQKFQANKANTFKLNSIIVKLCSTIVSNFNVVNHLKAKRKYLLLYHAYEYEIQKNYKLLFRLLSLIYNPKIILSLQHLFMFGGRSQISHALELTDRYVESDIKSLLFPLFEDITIDERLKKLNYYFPQSKLGIEDILQQSLTRDFNKLSLYPRACAMMEIYSKKLSGFSSELVFNCGHPERLLSETALFVLKNNHPEEFDLLLEDLPSSERTTQLLNKDESSLLISGYTELLDVEAFHNLSEYVSVSLVSIARKMSLEKEYDSISIENLADKYGLLLFNRDMEIKETGQILTLAGKLVPASLLMSDGCKTLICAEKTVVWLFDKTAVEELIYDNADLANAVLTGIERIKTRGDE